VPPPDATEPDPPHLDAWVAFLRAHAQVVRVLDAELRAEAGLPLTWYDVLVQLSEAGGEVRMSELADRLLLSRSATTRLVDRVERAGLVERCVPSDDARGRIVSLTDDGRATLRSAAVVHLQGVQQHFARHLDAAEADVVARVLERVVGDAYS
jgi:DNA-binding MarR family transcriptional regulator